jgi:hypothetical protein
MGRLFTEYGIDFSTLFVQSVGAAQWPSAALGCPEPGTFADTSEAPYDGFYYLISNGSRNWEYHTNVDDSVIVRCDEQTSSNVPLVNITEQANLVDSNNLILMRRDFSTGNFEFRSEMTREDMSRVIALFNQASAITYAPLCTTVFRLDFVTSNGSHEIEFICEEDYKAFDVYWNDLHGTAPALGYIIGPYLTGDPVPQLPTASS